MKDFHCRDAGMSCDFVAKGSSNDEVFKQASEHAKQVHNMDMSPDLSRKVESLIHDENSMDHKISMARK